MAGWEAKRPAALVDYSGYSAVGINIDTMSAHPCCKGSLHTSFCLHSLNIVREVNKHLVGQLGVVVRDSIKRGTAKSTR